MEKTYMGSQSVGKTRLTTILLTAEQLFSRWWAQKAFGRDYKSPFALRGTPSRKGANVIDGQTRGDRKKAARQRVVAAYIQAQLDIAAERQREAKNAKRRAVRKPDAIKVVVDE